MESKVSGHWTDEQLIECLYGVGPGATHLDACPACQQRLSAMQARRQSVELNPSSNEDASFEFLAAQRRKIYARLTEPRWWSQSRLRHWTSVAAMALVLAGGFFVYEENHRQQMIDDKVSDRQLAQDVSLMAQDSEPQPTAPLQALFDE